MSEVDDRHRRPEPLTRSGKLLAGDRVLSDAVRVDPPSGPYLGFLAPCRVPTGLSVPLPHAAMADRDGYRIELPDGRSLEIGAITGRSIAPSSADGVVVEIRGWATLSDD